MTQLTEHFSLEEMTFSQTAINLGIKNTPNANQIACLKLLCEKVLEPIRVHYDLPVKVHSGFRNATLNKAVGGSTTSSHLYGQAADIEITGIANRDLAVWVRDNLVFDQIILEFYNPAEGANSGWVHVSYRTTNGGNRKQTLTALKDGSKTVYVNGFIAS